jgi:hypothetical protein
MRQRVPQKQCTPGRVIGRSLIHANRTAGVTFAVEHHIWRVAAVTPTL